MNLNKNERLSLESFGANLIETEDLDPIYVVLHKSLALSPQQKRRWLLAYWCCYHAGCASFLSEFTGGNYWGMMSEFARNETVAPTGGRWPRGRERRHFRGGKAVDAVKFFSENYPTPEGAVHSLEAVATSYGLLMDRIQRWPQFGPWIAFKIADMMERVLHCYISFPTNVLLYDSPRKAAIRWKQQFPEGILGSDKVVRTSSDSLAPVIAQDFLATKLQNYKAPPSYDRHLGVQEFETILCKWGAHMDGIYPIGIDTHELGEALRSWEQYSEVAAELLTHLPRVQ